MSVKGRVIAGKYRHRPLTLLFDNETRSTKERVKEALFSAISRELENKVILDLFAGSGALGIEALSRGASTGIFCEINEKTLGILRTNLTLVEEHVLIFSDDYKHVLKTLEKGSIDLVFVDPPYNENSSKIIAEIYDSNILTKHYIIVVETEEEFTMLLNNAILKKYKYGRTHITIIRGTL